MKTKHLILIAFFNGIFLISTNSFSQLKTIPIEQKSNDTIPVKRIPSSTKIDWMTWEEAQVQMKIEPKLVYVDFYTDWCGWCKVMDKKTFANKNVIKYMNEKFYCIKFDAESKKEIEFKGKKYSYNATHKSHDLAIEILNGKMSYPTSVFFDDKFKSPQPVQGYLELKEMEKVVKFFGDRIYKTKGWENHQKSFVPTWK